MHLIASDVTRISEQKYKQKQTRLYTTYYAKYDEEEWRVMVGNINEMILWRAMSRTNFDTIMTRLNQN